MSAISCAVLPTSPHSLGPRRVRWVVITAAAVVSLAACARSDTAQQTGRPGTPPPGAFRVPEPGVSPTPPPPPSEVVDTGPVFLEGHAVIRPEAVGPLHVGQWRRAAMSFVYALTSFGGTGDMEITPVHKVGKDTVTVVIVNDTVQHLEVMRPGARTVEGFGVGTPLAALSAAPGASVAHEHGATVITLARYCGIQFSSADSSAHSGAPKKIAVVIPPDSAAVRTVIVGKCAAPRT